MGVNFEGLLMNYILLAAGIGTFGHIFEIFNTKRRKKTFSTLCSKISYHWLVISIMPELNWHDYTLSTLNSVDSVVA